MQSSQRPLFDSIAARKFNRGKKAEVDLGLLGAKLGSIGLRFLTPLAALRGIILLRTLPSSVCFGENCDASET
jgi:hypothetical protein